MNNVLVNVEKSRHAKDDILVCRKSLHQLLTRLLLLLVVEICTKLDLSTTGNSYRDFVLQSTAEMEHEIVVWKATSSRVIHVSTAAERQLSTLAFVE
jgi:hypothetical protein